MDRKCIDEFFSLFEYLKKPFYLLDIIEWTPKSCPILTCTNMKLDALPKNEWNDIFLNNGHNAINQAFNKVSPKIE